MSFSDWGEGTGLDRRKLLVIVVSVIVGGGALILMLAMLFNKNNAPAQAAPTPAGTTVGDAAQEAAQPMEVLVAPPANVTWKPYAPPNAQGAVISLPSSPEYGPTVITTTHVGGYERSSAGALMAAPQIVTRFGESTAQSAYVIGPGKEQALERSRQDTSVDGEQNSFQGFKILGQPTNQQVLVDLLIGRGTQFQPSSCTLDLRWADNDWRIYAPTSDVCLSVQQAVSPSDSASYVQWGPG